MTVKRHSQPKKDMTEDVLSDLSVYDDLLQTVGVVIFVTDSRGYFTTITKSVTKLTGHQASELIGKHFTFIIEPAQRDEVLKFYQEQFVQRIAETKHQLQIVASDGSLRWIEQTVKLVENDQGECSFRALVHNITEQKRAEEQARASESRFNALLDAVVEGVILHSDGIIIDSNNVVERMVGYTREEIIGKSITHFVDPRSLGPIQQRIDSRSEEAYEILIRRKDGSIFPAEVRGKTVEYQGRVVRVATIYDMTVNRTMQERLLEEYTMLRTVIDNIPDHISVRDRDGIYLMANRAYARNVGVEEPEGLIGKRYEDFFPPEIAEQFNQEDQAILQNGEALLNTEEVDIFTSGEEQQWFSFTKVPLKDRQESIQGFVTIARNITQHKRHEQEIQRREKLYSTLVANLPGVAVYLYDQDLRYIVAEDNNVLGRLHQHRKSKASIGDTLFDVVDTDILARLEQPYRAVFDGKETDLEISTSTHDFILQILPIRNEAGEIFAGMMLVHDITERRREEQELRESEERFRMMADHAPVLIWMSGMDMVFNYFNKGWREFTGHSPDDESNSAWLELVHPDDLERYSVTYDTAFAAHESFQIEYRLRHKSGEYRWILDHGTPRSLPDGSFAGYIGSCIDIHDRKQAEYALEMSERRNRALLQAIPDMMFVIDANGSVLDYHPAESTAFSMVELNVIGMSLRDGHLPQDVVEEMLYYAKRALAHNETHSFEYQLTGTGEDRSYEARVVAVSDQNALIIVRDMTDLKRVEEELSRHIEDLTVLYQIESELTDHLSVNYVLEMALDSAIRLSSAEAGFIALRDQKQMVLAHSFGPFDDDEIAQLLAEPDASLRQVIQQHKACILPNVQEAADYTPLLDTTHARIVVPLMSQDIAIGFIDLETSKPDVFTMEVFEFLRLATSRIAIALDNARLYRQTREQLQELQRLYEQVRNLEQIKTDMIRIASHDLRNPLATIRGYLQLLTQDLQGVMDDAQMDHINMITSSANRMQKIVSDILSLERIEEAAQHSTNETFNLANLVRKTYQEYLHHAKNRHQQYRLEINAQDAIISGDPLQLHEAIVNLIGNAIKYTPDGGEIAVRVGIEDRNVQFRVQDTGYGVPPLQQVRLFQPFFRAKSKATKHIEGTGLGLNLVKNIVERHGGTIYFRSTEGEGSTFGFNIPVVDASAD